MNSTIVQVLDVKVKFLEKFNNEYSVNDYGEVWSHNGGKDTLLKQAISYSRKRGRSRYKQVCLSLDGKQECYFVHRLLAEAFIPNPDNKLYVNHLDGDKLNNELSNLQWCTPSENSIHAVKTGLQIYFMYNEEDRLKEVDLYLLGGSGKLKTTIRSWVKEEDLIRNHIPPELLYMRIKNSSFKNTWKRYYEICKMCKTDKTGAEISKLLKINETLISKIRRGLRWKEVMEIFNKYENNIWYTIT